MSETKTLIKLFQFDDSEFNNNSIRRLHREATVSQSHQEQGGASARLPGKDAHHKVTAPWSGSLIPRTENRESVVNPKGSSQQSGCWILCPWYWTGCITAVCLSLQTASVSLTPVHSQNLSIISHLVWVLASYLLINL
jgi:hypothetical protein